MINKEARVIRLIDLEVSRKKREGEKGELTSGLNARYSLIAAIDWYESSSAVQRYWMIVSVHATPRVPPVGRVALQRDENDEAENEPGVTATGPEDENEDEGRAEEGVEGDDADLDELSRFPLEGTGTGSW